MVWPNFNSACENKDDPLQGRASARPNLRDDHLRHIYGAIDDLAHKTRLCGSDKV